MGNFVNFWFVGFSFPVPMHRFPKLFSWQYLFGIDSWNIWIQYCEFAKFMIHEMYEKWTSWNPWIMDYMICHTTHESYSLWLVNREKYAKINKNIKNPTASFVGFAASFVGFAADFPVHRFLVVFEKLKTCSGLVFPLVSIALRPSWMVKIWLVRSNSTIGVKTNCTRNWLNWRPTLNKNSWVSIVSWIISIFAFSISDIEWILLIVLDGPLKTGMRWVCWGTTCCCYTGKSESSRNSSWSPRYPESLLSAYYWFVLN